MLAALGGVAWWVLIAGAQPLTVEGTACLEAADVERALDGLIPDGGGAAVAVELAAEPEALVVRVRRQGGDVLAERALPPLASPGASCRERAQEIAVVVAAAVGTPQGPAVLGAPPPPAGARMGVAMSAPPAAAPAPLAVAAAPPPAAAPLAARASLDVPSRPSRPLELAAALGTTLAAGSFAPAARLQATLWLREPLGLRLTALYDGDHLQSVGAGQAVWSRLGAGGALAWRRPVGRSLAFEANAALVAAFRTISGRGFLDAATSHTFDPGAGAGWKLTWHGRRLGLWAGADATLWPRTQGVFVRDAAVRGDLAAFDVFFGLGLSLSPVSPVTPAPDPT